MSTEFKKCPNGHYYQGATCPYCKSSNATHSGTGGTKTEVFGGGMGETDTIPGGGKTQTEPMPNGGNRTEAFNGGGGNRTRVVGGFGDGGATAGPATPPRHNQTVFGNDTEETNLGGASAGETGSRYRSTRKLVGWLVSYTLDAMGVDFKLYEGRNIIGRDMDCNITVNDQMVSGKHAVILFRAGKYSITDQQSSHGTFVNGEDIELEPRYIKDNDEIRMGETIFKFRTSF